MDQHGLLMEELLAFFKTLKNTNNEFETKLFTIDITGNLEKELKTPLSSF